MLVDRQLGFTVTRRATDKVLSQYEGDGDHAVTAEEVARLVEELQRASPQALTVALESEDVRTRWRAASELKQDAAALELQAKALSLRLKHQDPGVRLVVLDVLAACPPAALAPVAPQLSELLADGVWYVREAAVLCLAALDPHVLRSHAIELIDALEDESDAVGTAVRQAAIDALGSLRPDSISSYLLSRTQGLAHDPRRALRPQYARREGQQHRPPPPPNAQPSTLAKVANRMRGTGSASRTVASPVRTVRSQPDQQQAAGTRRKPAGGLYSAHRTFAPVSWPGARLPPGMRDDDLHSEPGRIAPASRPSRLDLARHGCNSSGGVSEPEASSPLARPSRLEAARQWAAQGEPLMNAALEEISSLSRSVGEVQQRPMSGPDPATLPVPSLVGQLSSGHQQQQWQQQQQQHSAHRRVVWRAKSLAPLVPLCKNYRQGLSAAAAACRPHVGRRSLLRRALRPGVCLTWRLPRAPPPLLRAPHRPSPPRGRRWTRRLSPSSRICGGRWRCCGRSWIYASRWRCSCRRPAACTLR
mmetsp:Transcript_22457/g.65568  ORF Transcript_22457/g.65568 Transcript_22457/m.65568 type:complete len:532 (-) Transcript_22457:701-2296(-)